MMQELKEEMARLRADNERLMQEHEKSIKSMSNKHNECHKIPSPKWENLTSDQEFHIERA